MANKQFNESSVNRKKGKFSGKETRPSESTLTAPTDSAFTVYLLSKPNRQGATDYAYEAGCVAAMRELILTVAPQAEAAQFDIRWRGKIADGLNLEALTDSNGENIAFDGDELSSLNADLDLVYVDLRRYSPERPPFGFIHGHDHMMNRKLYLGTKATAGELTSRVDARIDDIDDEIESLTAERSKASVAGIRAVVKTRFPTAARALVEVHGMDDYRTITRIVDEREKVLWQHDFTADPFFDQLAKYAKHVDADEFSVGKTARFDYELDIRN